MNNKKTSSDLRMTDVKFILRKLGYPLMKLREMPTLKERGGTQAGHTHTNYPRIYLVQKSSG